MLCHTASERGVFVFLMARFAALYFGKQTPHALGYTMMVAGLAGGAFIEGSKAQHREP